MKAAAAIKEFLNRDDRNIGYLYQRKISVRELKEFREACTDNEFQEFGKQAAELIGEKFESI